MTFEKIELSDLQIKAMCTAANAASDSFRDLAEAFGRLESETGRKLAALFDCIRPTAINQMEWFE